MAWPAKRAVLRPTIRKNASGTAKIKRDSYSNAATGVQWWTLQKEVLERDGHRCMRVKLGRRCGNPAVTVHHIRSLNSGGRSVKSNLMSICKDCHMDTHPHLRKARK